MDDPACHSERVMSAGNVMILWEIFATTIFISDDVRRRRRVKFSSSEMWSRCQLAQGLQ